MIQNSSFLWTACWLVVHYQHCFLLFWGCTNRPFPWWYLYGSPTLCLGREGEIWDEISVRECFSFLRHGLEPHWGAELASALSSASVQTFIISISWSVFVIRVKLVLCADWANNRLEAINGMNIVELNSGHCCAASCGSLSMMNLASSATSKWAPEMRPLAIFFAGTECFQLLYC